MNRKFYIFFGPPGSGKGTQADLLAEKYKLNIISPGEIFRKEVEMGTKLGKEIEPLMDAGKILKDDIVDRLIETGIKNKVTKKGVIFDGYPRRKSQLDTLNKKLGQIQDKNDEIIAILIDVGDSEVLKRLGGRRVCDCGESYHIKFNPSKIVGKCNICGKRLRVRDDDKPSVIKNRLKIYYKEIEPILKYYAMKDKLIRINGEQSIKKIAKDIEILTISL
jgi:adenylate kinase